jgi:PPOX class probable F420-dependent enzyme
VNEVELRRRFATAVVARLATVDADGQPHLVPIVFALHGETIYSVVDDKPKRTNELRRLRNVRANPRVAVLVDHYDDDWSTLWWVRADGFARVLERSGAEPGREPEPEAERAVALLAHRYPQQRATGPVLAIDVARWVGWSAGA